MKTKYILSTVALAGALFIQGSVALASTTTTGGLNYEDAGITFNGESTIPTSLNFGDLSIQTTAAETRTATVTGTQSDSATTGAVTVSDNRGDATGEWSIKLTQESQFAATTGEALNNASLIISHDAAVTNLTENTIAGNFATAGDLALIPGTTYDVLNAGAGEGLGETSVDLSQFAMNIAENTRKLATEYTTTLDWTFSSAPANSAE
ncbi:WxL domain-containing protein [Enterococcus sp. LJL90]